MPFYTVRVKMTQHLETQIEADNEEHAWKIAAETDGAEFSEIEGAEGWEIYDVEKE